MSNTRNIDPPKRCGCPKTDCLQLYCVCFAANRLCSEECSCKQCSNLLEHQDKVKVARKEAQMRLAVKARAAIQDPTLKKDKRGCGCRSGNCRHGLCMCYRALAGCLPHCQCEGCENDYGKKEDNEDKMIKRDNEDNMIDLNKSINSPQDII